MPPALNQIGHALDPSGHAARSSTGVRARAHLAPAPLQQLPTGTQLLHPVATYGHRADEAVVAIFFTLTATWYCVSERDSIIKLLTALSPESKREKARETYASTAASARARGFAS